MAVLHEGVRVDARRAGDLGVEGAGEEARARRGAASGGTATRPGIAVVVNSMDWSSMRRRSPVFRHFCVSHAPGRATRTDRIGPMRDQGGAPCPVLAAACADASSRTRSSTSGCRRRARATCAADQLDQGETFYPLHVRVCSECLLVQLPAYIPAEDIFSRLRLLLVLLATPGCEHAERLRRARRSSGSGSAPTRSWSRWPATTATSSSTRVARGIRSLGIEPAANVAEVAVASGVPTEVMFLGEETGREGRRRARPGRPGGRQQRLRARARHRRLQQGPAGAAWPTTGTSRIEIPHLLRLIEGNEYDTIYHEHYSYLSLLTTQRVLATAGLTVVDVEELPTPRRLAAHLVDADRDAPARRARRSPTVLADEAAAGLRHPRGARRLRRVGGQGAQRPRRVPRSGARARASGSSAYGAPGKGNTLLNHCGIRADLVEFSVDRNPFKHGRFLPGHPHPDPSRRRRWPRRGPTTC